MAEERAQDGEPPSPALDERRRRASVVQGLTRLRLAEYEPEPGQPFRRFSLVREDNRALAESLPDISQPGKVSAADSIGDALAQQQGAEIHDFPGSASVAPEAAEQPVPPAA